MTTASRGHGEVRRIPALVTGLVFVLAWLWLSLRPSAVIHRDTSRDLGMARDIVEGVELTHVGVPSSFVLKQGVAWLDFLASCSLVGLEMPGIERVLTTLLAASVALVYLGCLRALPPRPDAGDRDPVLIHGPAVCGAAVALASIPLVIEVPSVWQPTLLPVPVALAHLSLWRLVRTRALADALALAIFTALALDLHVVCLVLVVVVAAAIPLASERPAAASLAAAAVGLASLALRSRGAWLANIQILLERGWLWPAVLGLAVVVLAGVAGRRPFARLDANRKLAVVVGLELSILALLAGASLLDSTPSLTGRYLAPFYPALALAAALAVAQLATTRRHVAIAGVVAAYLLWSSLEQLRPRTTRSRPTDPVWTIVALEPIAEHLAAQGYTWTQLVAQIQGPDAWMLLSHLSTVVEPGSPTPPPPDAGVLIVALEGDDAERVRARLADDDVREFSIDDGGRALVIRTTARLRRYDTRMCRPGGTCEDVELVTTRRDLQSYPSAWIDGHYAQEGGGDDLRWQLPVVAGPAVVLGTTTRLPESCDWRFVAVEGFEPSTALPAATLELPAGAIGTVTVGRRIVDDPPHCEGERFMPPAIVELDPAWTELRQLLEN